MYYGSSNELDSVLESMFNDYGSSDSDDLSLIAALESFDNFAINTLGSNYIYASEGVGSAIKNAVKKVVGFIKKFFHDLGVKISKFWEGLFDKHKALQNKIEDAEAKVNSSKKHSGELAEAELMAAKYSKEFNMKAVDSYCNNATAAANAVKASCEKIKDVLTKLADGTTSGVTVPSADSVTSLIEKNTEKLKKAKEDILKKKEEFEDKILKTLSEKFKTVSERELSALISLTHGKLDSIQAVDSVAKEIDAIIKENEKLADNIDSKLTEPDDDAKDSEKKKYEKLKAGVDLWKEVARDFQAFANAVCDGTNAVITGIGKVSDYTVAKNTGSNKFVTTRMGTTDIGNYD